MLVAFVAGAGGACVAAAAAAAAEVAATDAAAADSSAARVFTPNAVAELDELMLLLLDLELSVRDPKPTCVVYGLFGLRLHDTILLLNVV